MPIRHAFQVAIPDDPAAALAGEILPSHWLADHEGSALTVKDEGVSLDTAVTVLNYKGAGVSAVENADHEIDITIPGGAETLAQVLTNGGDPGGNPVTGEFTVAPTDDTLDHLTEVVAPAGFPDNTSGNGEFVRYIDTDTGGKVFAVDVYADAVLHNVGGGSANWRLTETDRPRQLVLDSNTGVKIRSDVGSLLIQLDDQTPVHELTAAAAGFFGASPTSQRTAASLADLWTALQTYGLLDVASTPPVISSTPSFLSVAKWS